MNRFPGMDPPALMRKSRPLLVAASLLALWILHRPYRGIVHDARIYIGRAMAELDPAGVGRDLMFSLEQQSQFSVLTPVFTTLTDALGPSGASVAVTMVGIPLWLLAAWSLIRRLAAGRSAWVALTCVIVLPAQYAGSAVFSYAESIATPRLYAEAASLAGLACVLGHRRWTAGGFLLAGAAIHPLMALPAIAVVGVMLTMQDRRWLYPIGIGAAGLVAAALLDLPVARGLMTTIDAQWLQALRERNSYLFATLWDPADWSLVAVHMATVGVAASVVERPARRLLFAAAIVAAGGLATSVLLVDLGSNLLLAQLQLWRTLWLLAVLANASVAIAAVRLWPKGAGGRLVLGTGALSWLLAPVAFLALPLVAATLAIHRMVLKKRLLPTRLTLRTVWGVAGLALVSVSAVRGSALAQIVLAAERAGAEMSLGNILRNGLIAAPAAVVAILWALRSPAASRHLRLVYAAAGLLLIVGAVAFWDGRTPYQAQVEAGGEPVASLVETQNPASAILWLEGDIEPWMLAGRPSWGNAVQGAGLVFSRELAVEWSYRISTLIELGLAEHHELNPFADPLPQPWSSPPARSIAAVCSHPEGPGTVVIPAEGPDVFTPRTWRPDSPSYQLRQTDSGYAWQRFDRFSVISCNQFRP